LEASRPGTTLSATQFLFRAEDGEIGFYNETLWDDATRDVLRPGDEGHAWLAERYLIDIDETQGLVAEKRKILASADAQEKVKLQASYDEMFHYDWREPQSVQRASCSDQK
jgi:hypothetical protein